MCTTLFLLSTLAMLWRRRFANRVQPEPSDVDGAARGSSVDADPQSSGRSRRRPCRQLLPMSHSY
nr:photoreceptor disk component PRCD isoform X1 [Gorilla gorilla gorilla]